MNYSFRSQRSQAITYTRLVNWSLGVSATLLLVCNELAWLETDSPQAWVARALGIVAIIGLILVCIKCINVIGPDENGLLILFGQPKIQIGSGRIFLLPFYTLETATTNPIQEEYPGESIYNSKPVAIYITHGILPADVASADPLDNRITTSVRLICKYEIVNIAYFIAKLGSIENARIQLKELAIAATQHECSKKTVGQNKARIKDLNFALTEEVKQHIHGWGIELLGIMLQNIDLDGAINEALNNVPISISNSKATLHQGLTGAEVHEAFLYARGEGCKGIADKLGISEGEIVLKVIALENAMRKGNSDFIVSSNEGDLFRTIATMFKLGNNN